MALFTPTSIQDVILIEPNVFGDDRGFFMETYREDEYRNAGIDATFVQDNHSKSAKWVLRGLHFQTSNTQAKLVRVIRWAVLDVVVDIRKTSQTYGEYVAEILSATNHRQMFVPKGFAHGFLTLEDDTEFVYKCDAYYDKSSDGGIFWNDPELSIPWEEYFKEYGISDPLLSEKDSKQPTLADFLPSNPF